MKVLRQLGRLRRRNRPVVMAAGFFDGVHLGHQRVLGRALRRARECGGEAWVLTFATHPLRVLNPPAAPALLTSAEHKQRLFERLGLDGCLMLPFSEALAAREPVRFARELIGAAPPLAEIVAGSNWRFGRGGEGRPALLAREGRPAGLRVHVVRPVVWQGETISSTRLRASILRGNLEDAEGMLGRPFSIMGPVTAGRGVGRTLGFPTANISASNEVLPPAGVYAAWALVSGRGRPRLCAAAANIGTRPTFADAASSAVVEAHLPAFSGRLYGRCIELFLVRRLRRERAFGSPRELSAQIERDVRDAVGILAGKKLKESLYSSRPLGYSPAQKKERVRKR
jgi:riboflavin kinase/FMN adenylyltransferase